MYDEIMTLHDPGWGHPERPDRLEALARDLVHEPPAGTVVAAPAPATGEQLSRVHEDDYVQRVLELHGKQVQLDADTSLSERSVDAALLAAGAGVDAVTAVMSGAHDNAVALVRPPGHHAEAGRGMGFCVFNNVAIAAAHAVEALGCERVLVIDWDVHHGNGTQHTFESRRDVTFFSTHRYPFYPGTGAAREVGHGAGEGYTVNVPLPPNRTDGDYGLVFRDVLGPIAEQLDPDLVLVSAGFDAHLRDPLGGMQVSGDGFARLCADVHDLAERCSDSRLVLMLEGGYDLEALRESMRGCVEVLTGSTAPAREEASEVGERIVESVWQVQRAYWKRG